MAYDAFLKIEGIDGESTDKTHKGEIEISSFSFGATNPASTSSGGGGGQGKVSFQDFHFTMNTSKASPNLMLACATGKHIPQALLTLRKAGTEFVKIRLDDVLVSSYELGGETDTNFPMDEVTLNFEDIDYWYQVLRTGEVVETFFAINPAGA